MAQKKTGEHLILEIKKQNFESVSEMKSTLFTQKDFPAFEKLHNETFPQTYYDAATIVERLNISKRNILRVLKNNESELQGYAYYEIDRAMSDASLEYIGISKGAQNQGLGTLLLKEVLTHMFSYDEITKIRLTVDNENKQANYIYIKAGFEPKNYLTSFYLKNQ